MKYKDRYIRSEIISIPKTNNNIYTIQYHDGSIHQVHEKYIYPSDPTLQPSQHDPQLATSPSWITNGCKCTIFLNTMDKPSQGSLYYEHDKWTFRPGYKNNNNIVDFKDFHIKARKLINSYQLFKGHVSFQKVYQARSSFNLGKIVARHLSAKSLIS